MKPKIKIIKEGYSFTDHDNIYHASATCCLVITEQLNIIVDPGGAWEKNDILHKLHLNGIESTSIDIVVGTHGHSDHVGNLNLFEKAKHIVGFDINVRDVYEENDLRNGRKYVILKDQIDVIPTPGHMHHDVSVIVYNTVSLGTVGIVGDLFECENDEDIWKVNSECFEMQEKNRNLILQMCDHIVPGHGKMFKIKK